MLPLHAPDSQAYTPEISGVSRRFRINTQWLSSSIPPSKVGALRHELTPAK
jgi:hypothetical protein